MIHNSLAVFATLGFVLLALSAAAAEQQARPNIVLIMVDDMGYGDPGCYNGDSKISTPHIDSLAAAGMRFTDAHAPGPLCHMSRYGLLTGEYPFRTDVGRWRKHALIAPEQMTIASLLKSSGYRTAMVGKWHLGFNEAGYDKPLPGGPVDVGFDSYFGIRASTDIPPYFYIRGDRAVQPPTDTIEANHSPGWSPIQGKFWRAGGIAPDLELANVLPRFTDEAIEVIEKHPKEAQQAPLFLYLAYPAPHTPWLPSEEFDGKSGAGLYGDFMMMVDHMVGRVLDTLARSGLDEETLVIFTSDNGPVWYEEDVRRFGHDSSGGLRGMKADAWECGHRMPFIVRWPGRVSPGTVSDQLLCFTDVLSTLAAIVGKDLPAGAGPDSFSFLPVLLGRDADAKSLRQQLVMRSGNGTFTIRDGTWKLITALGSGGFSEPRRVKPGEGDPEGQLYDLSADLSESNNRYLAEPQIVARLSRELEALRAATQTRP